MRYAPRACWSPWACCCSSPWRASPSARNSSPSSRCGTDCSTTPAARDAGTAMRVPRTLLGLLVGAALGLAGALMQALTRNPLADPGLLGVNAGASAAVVTAIALLGVTSLHRIRLVRPARRRGRHRRGLRARRRPAATPVRLALAGAAVTAALYSLRQRGDAARRRPRSTGCGSGPSARWPPPTARTVAQVLPFIARRPAARAGCRPPAQRAGPRRRHGPRARRATRPHPRRARRRRHPALRRGHRRLRPDRLRRPDRPAPGPRAAPAPTYAGCCRTRRVLAPVLLLGADVLGRVVGRPGELQVGIVTAVLGGPLFLCLVRRAEDGPAGRIDPSPPHRPAAGSSGPGGAPCAGVAGRWSSARGTALAVVLGRARDRQRRLPDDARPTCCVPCTGGGSPAEEFIVDELRLPRLVTALAGRRRAGAVRRDLPVPGPQPAGQPRRARRHPGRGDRRPRLIVLVAGAAPAARRRGAARRARHRPAGLRLAWRQRRARLPAGAGRHRHHRDPHRRQRLPAHPGRPLMDAARAVRLAHRQPRRPGLGRRPCRCSAVLALLVPCCSGPRAALPMLELGDDTADALGVPVSSASGCCCSGRGAARRRRRGRRRSGRVRRAGRAAPRPPAHPGARPEPGCRRVHRARPC